MCSLLVSSVAIAAVKTPTITGSTGLIKMPTGDVLSSKDWNMGLDYVFDAPAATTPGLSDLSGTWVYKMNVGSFVGTTKGLELGFVGRTEKTTSRLKEGVFINMKYSLASSDDPDALHLAIGVENLTSSSESDAYMVASKYFTNGVGIHFGAMFDFPSTSKMRTLAMLGTNIPVGSPDLSVMAEAFSGESIFQLDAGLRYCLGKNYALLLRGMNVTNSDTSRNSRSYSLGISANNLF